MWSRGANAGCARRRHVIRTPRLLTRTPSGTDVLAVFAAASDPGAQRWLGWQPEQLIPEPQRRQVLEARPKRRLLFGGSPAWDYQRLVAIDMRRGAYAGMAVVMPVTPDTCEIGGSLTPAYRGQGLGAELFAAAYELAHDHFGFTEVRAGTEPENAACIRSLELSGFTPAHAPPPRRTDRPGDLVLAHRPRRGHLRLLALTDRPAARERRSRPGRRVDAVWA